MSVGVVIARFQVPDLTVGHRALLAHVMDRHETAVVLLGCSPANFTKRNPLPYWMRERMVHAFSGLLDVYPLLDSPSDVAWSEHVDKLLTTIYPGQPITLYGGRDSFQPHYRGNLKVETFDEVKEPSGTDLRAEMVEQLSFANGDTRNGVIFAVESAFTRVCPTVDVAILDAARQEVLMARKSVEENAKQWRFIGGFVDPTDTTLEIAARREVSEETGLETGELHYAGSFKVNDWRYRGGPEGIITTFFVTEKVYGMPKASDDIAELKWVPVSDVAHSVLPVHLPLARALTRFVESCSTTSSNSHS